MSKDTYAELGRISIIGYGNEDLDIVRGRSALELRLDLDHEFDARAFVTLDHGFCPNQWLDLSIQAVAHQLKFTVRRNERDCAVVLEARETHALVELDVFHFDRLSTRRCVSSQIRTSTHALKHHLVIEAQTQLGHAGEVALHLDSAHNFTAHDMAVGVDKQVDAFDHVQEHLVLAVSNTL